MQLEIRRATPGDAAQIARYNIAMAAETEQVTLEPERALRGVAALLADPGKGFYLVAVSGHRTVGQLMITYEWSDWRNGNFWWIQSVFVAPEFRRRGVFRRLYGYVMETARADSGVCGVRLYVDRRNRRAQQAYASLGLERTAYEIFEVDFVMRGKPGAHS